MTQSFNGKKPCQKAHFKPIEEKTAYPSLFSKKKRRQTTVSHFENFGFYRTPKIGSIN